MGLYDLFSAKVSTPTVELQRYRSVSCSFHCPDSGIPVTVYVSNTVCIARGLTLGSESEAVVCPTTGPEGPFQPSAGARKRMAVGHPNFSFIVNAPCSAWSFKMSAI